MEDGAGRTRSKMRLLRTAPAADRALRRLHASAAGSLSGAVGREMLAALREASAAEVRPSRVGRLLEWAKAEQWEWAHRCATRGAAGELRACCRELGLPVGGPRAVLAELVEE